MIFNFYRDSLDGERIPAVSGKFNMTDLVNYEDDHDNWDYRVVGEETVEGIQTVCLMLQNDAFNNIDVNNATNLFIDIPEFYVSENTISIRTYGEDLPPHAPEPSDFTLYKNSEYFIDKESTFDYWVSWFSLYGEGSAWDSEVNNHKTTALCRVLYLENGNCFGQGIDFRPSYHDEHTYLTLTQTIFNQFYGQYGEWNTPAHQAWAPHKGGILSGESVFGDMPWNSVSYSEYTQFKDIFSQSQTLMAPNVDFNIKGGFYIVGFKYNDTDYIGILAIRKNLEGNIDGASIWGATNDFWSVSGNTDYFVDAEGTVQKATPTGYRKSTYRPSRQSTPTLAENGLLQSTGTRFNIGGIVSGYETYVFDEANFKSFFGQIANPKLSTLANAVGVGDFGIKDAVTGSLGSAITSLWANPFDAIISANMLPVSNIPLSFDRPNDEVCCCGGMKTAIPTNGRILKYRYIDVVYYSSSFDRSSNRYLDYTNTYAELYIPFVGYVPLNIQDIVSEGTRFSITYTVDLITGNTAVDVEATSSTLDYVSIYSTTCNIASPATMLGTSNLYERMCSAIGGAIKSTVNIASSMATAGASTPAAAIGLNAAGGAMNATGDILHTLQSPRAYGNVGGSSTIVSGMFDPFIRVERPVTPQMSFIGVAGYPSAAVGTVGGVKNEGPSIGFNSFSYVDVSGITTATEAEKSEIETLLRSGIWITRQVEEGE